MTIRQINQQQDDVYVEKPMKSVESRMTGVLVDPPRVCRRPWNVRPRITTLVTLLVMVISGLGGVQGEENSVESDVFSEVSPGMPRSIQLDRHEHFTWGHMHDEETGLDWDLIAAASLQPQPSAAAGTCKDHTSLQPIAINQNSDFSSGGNGVVNPDAAGTPEDPYVIEGWCIRDHASLGFPETGIRIASTSMHLVIKDNVVSSNVGDGAGIVLSNAENVTVEKNVVSHNKEGIVLEASTENTIVSNTVTENIQQVGSLRGWGVILRSSHENHIHANNVSGNQRNGFLVEDSDRNVLTNNTAAANGYMFYDAEIVLRGSTENVLKNNTVLVTVGNGVDLSASSGTEVSGNIFQGGGVSIGARFHTDVHPQFPPDFDHYIQEIDDTNTVNGKRLVYVRGETAPFIPEDAGQVIVVDSRDVVIENLELSNVDTGISVVFSDNVVVRDSVVNSARFDAIDIIETANSTVQRNIVNDFAYHGIRIFRSDGVLVEDNVVTNNTFAHTSIELDVSSSSVVRGNMLSDSARDFIGVLSESGHNVIENNSMSQTEKDGIQISDFSSHNRVLNNTVDGVRSGIKAWTRSDGNLFRGNIVSNASSSGLQFSSASGGVIEANTVINARFGVMDQFGVENRIVDNVIVESSTFGIWLVDQQDLVIEGNNLENNTSGIRIAANDHTKVVQPVIVRNNWWGDPSGPGHILVDNEYSGPVVDACFGVPAIGEGDAVQTGTTTACFYPWLTEPNPEAGVQG